MYQERSEISSDQDQSTYSFHEFAQIPEYRMANQDFLREQLLPYLRGLPHPFSHIDVASGTGLVPQELITLAEAFGLKGAIIGIDPNEDSLRYARQDTPQSEAVRVKYVHGFGQDTERLVAGKIPFEGVDSVSIHDAIHEVPDAEKGEVLDAMASVLKPGGVLTLNSAFTTQGDAEDPLQWGMLKVRALNTLGRKRDKSVEAIAIHKPSDYVQMVESCGLKVIRSSLRPVFMSTESLIAISQYLEFIKGVFRDMKGQEEVSLKDKSNALIESAKQSKGLVRNWFELTAQKLPA